MTPGPRYDDAVADLDAGLDGVQLVDPAVAHQLACQAIAHVEALLATGLEGAVVSPGGHDHRLAFVNGEREGLLALVDWPRRRHAVILRIASART